MFQQRVRLAGSMTPTILAIMGLNLALFLAQAAYPPLTILLGLVPGRVLPYFPHTLLTYAFLHDPNHLGHILFNMLTLYFFGGDLDLFLGRRRFLVLYLGSAVAGGVLAALFLPRGIPVVGASGALYGLLTAYALYFPRTEVLLWFLLPIQIRYLVAIWVGISLFYSVFGSGGGVAHLAHLGGALFAFVFVRRLWNPLALWRDLKHRWRRRRFRRIQ